ncbi:cell division protein FtsA [Hoeflea sp. TYP-13]|uniref:cell division protein FtsA n=1 Tax=Hoeflea sp. TYP-13 TaxID=3230023 RepID=UPI0034C6382A
MSVFRSPSFTVPHLRALPAKRSSVVTVLDIGSTKVVCLIGKLEPREETRLLPGRTHDVEIIGVGHHKSRGIKAGVIADLDAVESSVRMAVHTAEKRAGLTVESLIVNISAGRLRSDLYAAEIDLGGHEVERSDLKKVLAAAASQINNPDRSILHSLPTGYSLDGERSIRDPLGMYGDHLGVDMHVLSAEQAPLRNLELCVNRAHLTVEAMVATPYASGLSALVDDEAEIGCACIDMGGGTTSISVFAEGRMVHADAIALGGHHVTMDLARGLSTRLEDAERLKVVHGSALPMTGDDHDTVSVPPIGDSESEMPVQMPKALLGRIVRARIEETLEMIRDRIQRSGYGPLVGRRIVLTGGASQLTGIADAARRILARNVRIGRPLGVAGLPAAAKGPAFSTAVGLMIYPQIAALESHGGARAGRYRAVGGGGRFARVGQWLKESF